MAASRRFRRAAWLAAIGMLLAAVVGVTPARAVGLEWTVDNAGDAGDIKLADGVCRTLVGTCTLRAAIQQANFIDPGVGNHHTINVPAMAITMILIGTGEDNAATGDFDIKRSVTIRGEGPGETIIQGSTTTAEDALDRIFDIQTLGIELILEDMTVRRGNAHNASGGAIRVNNFGADIFLDNVTLTQNRSFDGVGAAIAARDGALTIIASRITNNDSPDGAVIDVDAGTLTVRRSTFSGNHVWNGAIELHGDGDGLIERSTFTNQTTNGETQSALRVGRDSADGSSMIVRNSTFAGNDGTADSTVVFGHRFATLTIQSTTIAGNTGVGLSGSAGTSITNTVLAGNVAGNCGDLPTSLGNNLDTGNTCQLDAPDDIQNGDADLRTLADNGGSTRTRALGPESDAIDAGSNCPGIDQRGVSRPKDGDGNGEAICDIGAYEAPKDLALPTAPPPTAEPTPEPTEPPVTAAPTVAPTVAPSEAPSAAAPSIDPGASPSPTVFVVLPVASPGGPDGSPAGSPVPVPAVGVDGGSQVLVIGLGVLLLALLVGLFFALRRRRPKRTS